MSEPAWLSAQGIIDMHAEQLAVFGGSPGIRDVGLLESAVERPVWRWRNGDTDGAELAATYAFDLARGRVFRDGNRRIALEALMVFLRINDLRFAPKPAEATAIILALAAGEVAEKGLARWIRDNWHRS
jgi:death-on-curing protein